MIIDLTDPELFGNEAGEDEDKEILTSYFIDKPNFEHFYNRRRKIGFVRSRKGMGKSTLLKNALYRQEKLSESNILIYVKASDLYALQNTACESPTDHIYGWQQKICTRINYEIDAFLKHGFSDDSIKLIESSEIAGFRSRNIVSALFDRFKVKGLDIELARERIEISNSQAVLERIQNKKDVSVWLYIDDIDATFMNSENERVKVSTFFSACRNLVTAVDGLCIRASVRSDVWSIISQYDEALDKCEQYMLDLYWSTEETGRILESKILSYFIRTYPENNKFALMNKASDRGEIRKLVFTEPFKWSGRPLESFRPIHILSAGRPRWAAQLCKLAAADARKKNNNFITLGHIRSVLREYGKFRINDIYKEHRHQCSRLEDLVESFSNGQKEYTTEALLKHITTKIINDKGVPTIDGIPAENGSLTIAHFLFRIGFITARDENDNTGLGFIRFEDRPNLLSTTNNLDDNLTWEIHPSYREVLRIA